MTDDSLPGWEWAQQDEYRQWYEDYDRALAQQQLQSQQRGHDMPLNVSDTYAGDWLKAIDLKGRKVRVTISNVALEEVGDGKKMVVHFQGKDKSLVLNKTNAMVIADTLGDDALLWTGRIIELRPERVTFKGKMVDAIRVSVPIDQETGHAASQAQQPEPEQRPHLGVPDDDTGPGADMPF